MDHVENFLSSIKPWEDAYAHPFFSYCAIKQNDTLLLLYGRLFLNPSPPSTTEKHYSSGIVFAGRLPLSKLGASHTDLIKKMASDGCVKTPIGELIIPTNNKVSTNFNPFYREGNDFATRISVLNITGNARYSYLQELENIDWQLKASPEPYDSLNELLAEYSLGNMRGDSAGVEVVAYHAAAVSLNSEVNGESAQPSMYLASSLKTEKASIGYRGIPSR